MMTTEEYNDKPTGSNDRGCPQMTDLIPLDAKHEEAFMGAVWSALKADTSDLGKQQRILIAFRAIPTIDPAAIREAALKEAASECAEHAEAARKKLGASETREEAVAWALIVTRCDLLEAATLALIGEKK